MSNKISRRDVAYGLAALAAGVATPSMAQSEVALAQAINRSGLMRAMSQRIAKAVGLMALNVSPGLAQKALAQSQATVASAMELLTAASRRDAALAEPFAALKTEMDSLLRAASQPARKPDLAALTETADRVQVAADKLTVAFQAVSPVPSARIVNVSGRQRMLSQRMAKVKVLMVASGANDALVQQFAESKKDFSEALDYLAGVPVSNSGIRRQLIAAKRQWERYDVMLTKATNKASLQPVATESEAILVTLDRLTGQYETALRDILG